MAHSLSAKKRIRQNEKRRDLNRARRTRLRGLIRKVREAIIHHDPDGAETAFGDAVKLIDREASRGLIHRNTAARTKSRLTKRIHALRAEKK